MSFAKKKIELTSNLKAEIIDLLEIKDYNKIINILEINIPSNYEYSTKQLICERILDNQYTDLIKHVFDEDVVCYNTVFRIMSDEKNYPIIETIVKQNNKILELMNGVFNLYRQIIRLRVSMSMRTNSEFKIVNLISNLFPENINLVIRTAITHGNIKILDMFIDNHNVNDVFNEVMNIEGINISFNTIIYLQEKHYVDIDPYINKLAESFLSNNDIEGLKYCLDNDINANSILSNAKKYYFDIDSVKLLKDFGADFSVLGKDKTINIFIINDLNVVTYLVEQGLQINNYFDELLIRKINDIDILKYLISLGADPVFDDGFLFKYACVYGNYDSVIFLAEYGFDKDTIFSHFGNMISFKDPEIIPGYHNINFYEYAKIANFLIKQNAIISDPYRIFCIFSVFSNMIEFNEELLVHLLDYGIDLNKQIADNISYRYDKDNYILERVVHNIKFLKLCLKYGADPYINNHSPLKKAIASNHLESAEYLIECGSVVDDNFECEIRPKMKDLLDKHGMVTDKLTLKKHNTEANFLLGSESDEDLFRSDEESDK